MLARTLRRANEAWLSGDLSGVSEVVFQIIYFPATSQEFLSSCQVSSYSEARVGLGIRAWGSLGIVYLVGFYNLQSLLSWWEPWATVIVSMRAAIAILKDMLHCFVTRTT